MSGIIQLLVIGLAVGGVYALVALGFVLIFKSSGLFNVAQGEVLMLAAMFCYTLSSVWGLPMAVAILLTMICSFALGYLIERSVIRPMIGQPVLAIIMMTIGLGAVLRGVSTIWIGPTMYSYPQFLPDISFKLAGVSVASDYIWAFLITMITMVCCILFFRFTRIGLSMRATAENPLGAQAAGIRASKIFGASWAMACLAAAISGVVLGMLTSVNNLLSTAGLKSMSAAVVGGLDSIPGTVIGGMLVGLCEAFAGKYLEPYITGIKDAAPYVVLLIVMLIKPQGLLGLKKIERV